MELSAYIRILRRWGWLIGLVAIVFGGTRFIITRSQPPEYQASATIQVGAYLNMANPATDMIHTGEELAQTYAALVRTRPVLKATIDKLQLPLSTVDLNKLVQTKIISNTSLLVISVTHPDPTLAADITNELTKQLIDNSPTYLTEEQKQQLDLLNRELGNAQSQLQAERDELSAIDKTLKDGTAGDRAATLTARRSELVTQINAAQANLAQMASTIATLQQESHVNSLNVVEPAVIPEDPTGASAIFTILAAAIGGAVLVMIAVLLIEYLNDTVRSPSEIVALLKVSPIGTIGPFGKRKTYKDKLASWTQPHSTIAEAYRALRVNLIYAEKDQQIERKCRKYIVTSPGPEEGKSVTVANLSVTFAKAGMRVLLIDADLRRPTQHVLFNLPNTNGLASIWSATNRELTIEPADLIASTDSDLSTTPKESMARRKLSLVLPHLIQKSFVPNLDIITAGPSTSNPAELLGTGQLQELVHRLEESNSYDVILVDTPPFLVVSDTSILANITQSEVILVVQAGRTHRGSLARCIREMTTLSIPFIGVVMNRLNPRDIDASYGQYYYGYYGYGKANAGSSNLSEK